MALWLHPSLHHTTCPSSFSSSVSASTELFVISNGAVYLKGLERSGLGLTHQNAGAEAALRVSLLHQIVAVSAGWLGAHRGQSGNKTHLCRTLAAPFSEKCLQLSCDISF